jgi:hypothetical protein
VVDFFCEKINHSQILLFVGAILTLIRVILYAS